ncbi:MAG: hypothetical protein Q9218_003936 [Villophora microphyllina]
MLPRVTRGAVAKEASHLASVGKGNGNALPQGSGAELIAAPTKKTPAPKKKPRARKPMKSSVNQYTNGEDKEDTSAAIPAMGKRKRIAALDDPNELPHGMGKVWKPSAVQTQEQGTSVVKDSAQGQVVNSVGVKQDEGSTPATEAVAAAAGTNDQPKANVKEESPAGESRERKVDVKASNTRAPAADPADSVAAAAAVPNNQPTKKPRKKKANPYGLTPGITPYPDFPHPTPEECQTVNDLLSSVHGHIAPPEKIPEPSLTVTGCGEVPSVLDALIRTYLSSNIDSAGSSRMLQGIIKEYGLQTEGIGKGSVDWDAVRRSDLSRLENAIRTGGIWQNKSSNIKALLDGVYAENKARRSALLASAAAIAPMGGKTEGAEAKHIEIAPIDEDLLSLDHLHGMTDQEAFFYMLGYKGIGPKTASCVSLFCLRRPSFAVDTHVFRHCKWLGWVPEECTTEIKTFMHCDAKVPDHLKYSLHQLFIKHGQRCGSCMAKAGQKNADGWDHECVIDHLMKRVRKERKSPVKKKAGQKRKKSEATEDEEDEESEDDGEDDVYHATPAKSKPVAPANPLPDKKTPIKKGTAKDKQSAAVDEEKEMNNDESVEPKAKKAKATTKETPIKKQPEERATRARKK